MKKNLSKVLSLVLVLYMLASLIVPFAAFAETNATKDERVFVFRETFSSGTVNTSGNTNNIVKAKGYFLCVDNGSTYDLSKDSLDFTSRAQKDYTDIRFYHDGLQKDLTQDFILSFWIKPDTDNLTITTWTWKEFALSDQESGLFKIMNGHYQINGVDYTDAHLAKDTWSLVEIVYNYDENATSIDGKQGATTSYTFLLNGKEVTTANATYAFHNIDRWRMMQWATATYELDDLTVALGSESLIDIPRTAPANEEESEEPEEPSDGEVLYREEFDKGFINVQNVVSAVAGSGGFWANNQNGSEYDLNGGALNFTKRVSADFIDLRFYIDGNKKDMTKDMTLSFWINPSVSNFSTGLAWGEQGVSSVDNILKVNSGKLVIGGTTYSSATLAANEWSYIEILFDYNKSATSANSKTGAFVSYTVKLNGVTIGSTNVSADKSYNTINNFRLFRYSNAPFSIDDLCICVGHSSSFEAGRSAAPVPVQSQIVFREDFNDAINSNTAQSAVEAANGFVASITNGSTYTLDGGTLNYTENKYRDYLGLQFYHNGSKLEITQDFVLSYKIKSTSSTTYRMYWKDHAYSTNESSFRHWVNNFRIGSAEKTAGITNPDAFTKPGEWALIELFFYYDENATAVTGQTGAFTFYSVYLNGEYVQTAKTMYNFHVINEFTLFSHSEDDYSIDDLTIAIGNTSLGGEGFTDGWDKMDYFVESTTPDDYDYSFCIVGDTQCLSGWERDGLNTMYQWIADNIEARKIKAVIGLGDITTSDTAAEWDAAKTAIALLQDKVLYTLIRGNHDGDEMLNKYYNNDAYKSQLGGFYDENNINTFWVPIQAGSDKYIIIGLDYGPTDAELAWAESIIAANPDHKIIITTHAYMNGNGGILEDGDFGDSSEAGTNSGNMIWDKLGRKYANIQMILCGHMEGDYITVRQDRGDHGNVVTQMMINPQWIDDAIDGGTGTVTMFYFKEGSSVITIETYSTVEQKHFLAENQFSVDLVPVCEHEYDNDCDTICNECKESREPLHTHTPVVTDPDCENDGYTTYTCPECGDSYVADETGALGHDYAAVVTAPDCENGGYTTYTCSVCGDSYVADETNALGHDHDAVVTAPDCENGGYTTYTCSVCGDSYVADETGALGHDWADPTYEAPKTCTECGKTEGNPLEKTEEPAGLDTGAIIGIVVGAVAAVALAGFVIVRFLFKKKI